MPSPACQVKEGAGAYGPTTNGVNVTPAATITINLISSAGVSTWAISCITTDNASVAATVNAGLTIDAVAKTATFTAPAAGRAYRFQSKINGGIGPDGTAQASYTTTFCVYTLTGGRRVHAVDETFESDSTFGWIADFNDLIRNPSSGATPNGTNGDVLISNGAGDFGTAVSPGTISNLLTSTGSAWASQAPAFNASAITAGTLAVARGGTGITSLGTGMATWWGIPSSANLAATVTDETGTGALTFANTPTLITPKIQDLAGGQTYNIVVSDLAANRNVTLPLLAADDTFVFANFTQTLTNKTVSGPSFDASSYLSTGGGTVHTTALIRVPYSAAHVILGAKNSGATDYPVIAKTSSTGLVFGDTSAWDTEVQGFTVKLWCHTTAQAVVQVGSTEAQRWSATKIETSLPLGGSSTNSKPYRLLGGSISMTNGSNTASAAQYENVYLILTTGAGTPTELVLPDLAGATFNINNTTGFSINLRKTAGSGGVSIATGTTRWIRHNGDYVFTAA